MEAVRRPSNRCRGWRRGDVFLSMLLVPFVEENEEDDDRGRRVRLRPLLLQAHA